MAVIKEEFTNGVYTIVFNRPEKRNALNLELIKAFGQALNNAREKNSAIVVIRGEGKTFTAGGDLFDVGQSPAHVDAISDSLHRCVKIIRKINAIVIAVLEGLVAGAGVGIAMACDLSVAEKNACIKLGYRKLGLTPGGGATMFFPRTIGVKKFNEMFFLSRDMGMEEALEAGLVNFVWPEEELEEKLRETIKALIDMPMEPIYRYKELINHAVYPDMEVQLDRERFHISQLGGRNMFRDRIKARCNLR